MPQSPNIAQLLGESEPTALPTYCRYDDLRKARICSSWPQLRRMVTEQGFPVGIMISPNVRAFPVHEVLHWLRTRPVEPKKIVLPYRDKAEATAA
jgi:hypothetical protein